MAPRLSCINLQRGLYFQAFDGSAALPVAGYNYNSVWTPLLAGLDCLADDAVSCELVSAPNSLLTGKLTGNFADSGSPLRFWRPVSERIQ
jgi:hypothetical protein